ncbi:recombinase family protein [Desulfocurvibacter africanus]|uniref:recombinase family protein n=1 Tax=Desulfocurvibacter africanus TaxID=873 RepID=UPI0003F9E4D3|nr:helix-turn-helix domain-containing protein [Desulfocurvibacter africanus]
MPPLLLQIIGAVAEFERAIIKERQREGIRAAQKSGKQMGRAKALTPVQVEEIKARVAKGETKKGLAQEYGISRQTLYAALVP